MTENWLLKINRTSAESAESEETLKQDFELLNKINSHLELLVYQIDTRYLYIHQLQGVDYVSLKEEFSVIKQSLIFWVRRLYLNRKESHQFPDISDEVILECCARAVIHAWLYQRKKLENSVEINLVMD